MNKNFVSKGTVKAFTLTEVLLAVAIVGIIAALVLPMVSTHYQNELYNHAYKREIDTIESAVEGLSVNENKANFFNTMMYTSSEPEDYKESSEKFLRKYVKTTKICSEAKDCFAQEYYEYTKDEQNRNVKKEYKPEYKGSCGILKNGMSMCITPQIGGEGIHGIIDLNGKKGPNVHNRDLREFSLSSRTRVGINTETEAVRSLDWENMDNDPCDADPTGLSCCKTKTITDPNDDCCEYDEIKDNNPNCKPEKTHIIKTIQTFYCSERPNMEGSLWYESEVSISQPVEFDLISEVGYCMGHYCSKPFFCIIRAGTTSCSTGCPAGYPHRYDGEYWRIGDIYSSLESSPNEDDICSLIIDTVAYKDASHNTKYPQNLSPGSHQECKN